MANLTNFERPSSAFAGALAPKGFDDEHSTADAADDSVDSRAVDSRVDDSHGVNYDGEPLFELTLEDVDYRLDAGKQGTALCVSTRASGTWGWAFCCEAKWDGSALRARALERSVREALALAFKRALMDLES